MFNWLFGRKKKQAAAVHEAELTAKLAEKLKYYNADKDISVSDFSEIDFDENDEKRADRKGRVKNTDVWGEANPGETGKWIKEDRRLKDRRLKDPEQKDPEQKDSGQKNRRQTSRRRIDRR
jgi:hypothetical protein